MACARSWKRDEPRRGKEVHTDSGGAFVVSEAALDNLETQVREAIAYLEANGDVLTSLVATPGLTAAVLDFGIAADEGVVAKFVRLPPRLIQRAASLGLGIEISIYAAATEEPDASPP